MLATNQILHKGRYRIINSFCQDETGGMYEAFDTVSNINVVLRENIGKLGKIATSSQMKEINDEFAGGARALKDIKHESLVSVQDYFSELDRQYLVLEAVTGFNLTKFLQPDEHTPSFMDVLSWGDQLLNALEYMHKLAPPVIHRDIRPENIKLTSSLKVKLLTAGVATNPVPGSDQTAVDTAFNYRPLEQLWVDLDPTSQRVILNSYDDKSAGVLLRPLDGRSDLYSVAASLYHIMTGTMPADALDRSIAMLDGKPDPLQKPADLDSSIPPEVSDAFMRAMAIRRENRFDSATIMRQVLKTAVIRVEERKAEEAENAASNQNSPEETVNETKAEHIEISNAMLESQPNSEEKSPDSPCETDSAEAQLDHERSNAEERRRELEAEQSQLEEEQKRIEQRQQELEEAKKRHLAERERLELEAEQARLHAEQVHKRIEKEKLEQEIENERQQFAQRLAELEAEQARQHAEEERLEIEAKKERRSIEQRMSELEAEQEMKRQEKEKLELEAEAERQRAAQKLAELEAEKETRRLEEERLEHKAEEERKSAEARLRELESEQEHYRSEQKRIEAEAQKEREHAQKRLKELSGETPIDLGVFDGEKSGDIAHLDDDQFLLELDPGQPKNEPSVFDAETPPDDVVEANIAENPIAAHAILLDADDSDLEFDISGHRSGFKFGVPVIAGTIVFLLIVVVAAWMLMSSDTVETKPSVAADQTAVQTDRNSVSNQEQPAVESVPPAAPEPVATTDEPAPVDDKIRPVQLNTAQDKVKKPAPAPARTPPPKKKVTVDDLINDN